MTRHYKKIIEDFFYNSVNTDLTAKLLTEFIECLKFELKKAHNKTLKKHLENMKK